MLKNNVKEKISKGMLSVGLFMELDHPGVAQIVSDVGFDWIVLDAEHGHYTTATLRNALDAMQGRNVSPMIRVPDNDSVVLKQILDLGPEGVVIPMVCSKEECEAAVKACKYPPVGIRGVGPGRATGYGNNMKEYLQNANENILVAVQVEHIDAVNNIEEILKVEGIDVAFIGPFDLSASMGITGDMDHPELLEVIDKTICACKKAGVAIGMWCKNEKHAVEMYKKGVQFIVYSTDTMLLLGAAQNSLKEVLERCNSSMKGCY